MSSSLGVVLPDPAADAEAAAGLLEVAVRALREAGVDEVVVLDRPDRRSPPAGRSDGALPRTLALAAASARAGGHDRILLHRLDHALTPAAQVARVLGALDDGAAVAVPVLPVTDTVTAVAAGLLGRTVDRTHVRAVCSPWGFTRAALERAADAASAGGSGPATPGAAP
ncbi:2-C-methyl-D-erythritol 4-phosphate cytidylyltransferase, partial [Tersicoccus solisilvae]|uniref:2-C-methyl-D-erythritol 4-phosphate cytidylyltransferase n=1 Tax=Tersicoccus solisilvae TaxID=1882339 RepID=UPI00166B4D33